MSFILSLGIALIRFTDGNPQVAGAYIATDEAPYSVDVIWERAPSYRGHRREKLAAEHRIAVIRCDRIQMDGQLQKCVPIKWAGSSASGDKAALSALKTSSIQAAQISQIGNALGSASAMVTIRFDEGNGPLEPGPNCPITLCSTHN